MGWRIKLALVILHADPSRGGAERYTCDLTVGLRARGHHVSLVASSFAEGGKGKDEVALAARGATRARRYANFLHALDEHLTSARYEVVHAMLPVRRCHVYHPHAGVAAESDRPSGTAARMRARLNFRRQMFASVERSLLSGADAPVVLCLSEYVKGSIRRHYDLPEEKLATLFNSVDLGRFDPDRHADAGCGLRRRLGLAAENRVALMMAQDFERKGLRQAILAVARVSDPRLVLLVAGKENAAPYRLIAKAQGIADRVIFAGHAADPYPLYKAADFLLLPTRHDPCSLVVLEALAMGLPVITTVFNGASEIMNDGVHGVVLADPRNVNELAAAVGRMLNAPRRQAMAQASLALRPALSFEHHLDQIIQIYERVRARG